MYNHKATTSQILTKLNDILKFLIDDQPLTDCNFMVAFAKHTKFFKSVVEPQYNSTTKFCWLTKKYRLEGNGLSETVDREAIFDTKFIFASFSIFDIVCKSDYRKAGLILYTSHLTHFRLLIIWQTSILTSDAKLWKTNDPKPSRKVAQILLKFFSIFVTLFTKSTLTTTK